MKNALLLVLSIALSYALYRLAQTIRAIYRGTKKLKRKDDP